MSRRRKTAVAVTAVLTAGAAVAAVAAVRLPDAAGGEKPTSALPAATAAVTKQTLVDRQSEDGTLAYGDTTAVMTRLAGTVTGLPAAEATIKRGKSLYRIDNSPVVLLYGKLPAYRKLAPGVEGSDVKQFEQNLWALGYRGFTVDKTYSSATADAVQEWQDDLGLSETGTVDPDRIVYAAGPVRVDSLTAALGSVVQPGAEVLATTRTSRVATVDLDISDQRLAKKGATVEVTLPDGSETKAKIIGVETVAVPAEGNQPASTKIVVTIGFSKAPKGLNQASVTVGFTASQRKDVLTVPIEALLALAEGGYGVQVVEGSSTRIVAVETGLFADGRVEVSGDGITAGTTVGMPT
jgi:peptidoglycan hydrolase-like protein with peptidoglycan-binding domain